jgi:pseudouridine-5'-phosphate glycosidase
LDSQTNCKPWLAKDVRKISTRDFAPAIIQKASGGTTVAGTILAAHAAGIEVFATGGIGGVHHQPAYDISADLNQLSRTPMVVVCAGAKAILNLPATLEVMETLGIPVIGYRDEFATFFANSGSKKLKPVPGGCGTVADSGSSSMEEVRWWKHCPRLRTLKSEEVDLQSRRLLKKLKKGILGRK